MKYTEEQEHNINESWETDLLYKKNIILTIPLITNEYYNNLFGECDPIEQKEIIIEINNFMFCYGYDYNLYYNGDDLEHLFITSDKFDGYFRGGTGWECDKILMKINKIVKDYSLKKREKLKHLNINKTILDYIHELNDDDVIKLYTYNLINDDVSNRVKRIFRKRKLKELKERLKNK